MQALSNEADTNELEECFAALKKRIPSWLRGMRPNTLEDLGDALVQHFERGAVKALQPLLTRNCSARSTTALLGHRVSSSRTEPAQTWLPDSNRRWSV